MEFAVVEGWRRLLGEWRYQLGSRVLERRGTRVGAFLCSEQGFFCGEPPTGFFICDCPGVPSMTVSQVWYAIETKAKFTLLSGKVGNQKAISFQSLNNQPDHVYDIVILARIMHDGARPADFVIVRQGLKG
jgi:hypothetical protein